MRTYSVKFDCLMPCEITTIVEAENFDEAFKKIYEFDFENFRYRTKGKMYNIDKVEVNELEI